MRIRFSVILIFSCLFYPGMAAADDPKARDIMQKVEDRDDGDNMTGNMEMILVDKKGKQRVRKLRVFEKDRGKDTLMLMFFLEPDSGWHTEIGRRILGAPPFQDGLQPGVALIRAILAPAPTDHQGLNAVLMFWLNMQETRAFRRHQPFMAVASIEISS